jgi:hypothetical protein
MKKNLLIYVTVTMLLLFSQLNSAQKATVNRNASQTTAIAPDLLTTVCYALFTASGEMTNVNNTSVTGDIGTNLGTSTGFNPLNVNGEIHLSPDVSTGICSVDVNTVFDELNAMSFDTQLANPAMLGNDMILSAQAYLLNAATILTGNLYLDAESNLDAVFIFHVTGAFSSVINARVILINGAQAKNVFWKIVGAVDIAANTDFVGTIVSKNGAISIGSGSTLEGRALTTNGAVSTNESSITMTPGCNELTSSLADNKINSSFGATFYSNQGNSSLVVNLKEVSITYPTTLKVYDSIGNLVVNKQLTNNKSLIQTNLPLGVYFYHLSRTNENTQTGKLMLK